MNFFIYAMTSTDFRRVLVQEIRINFFNRFCQTSRHIYILNENVESAEPIPTGIGNMELVENPQ